MNLEIQQILTQILGFLILLYILKRFAWKPLLSLLDERREKIASEFKNIEKFKEELSRIEEDYKAKLSEIDAQARIRIQEAIAEGQRISIEIQDKARDEAKKLLEKAKVNIELEMAKAKVELRNEVATLAIMAAERILREELDGKKQKKLVIDFIERVAQLK